LEGVGQIGHVGCCCQAISETADEEETVWFADSVGGVFECDEGFCLDCVLLVHLLCCVKGGTYVVM
jgi:hypothetical protein